jgi:hypothetical protein
VRAGVSVLNIVAVDPYVDAMQLNAQFIRLTLNIPRQSRLKSLPMRFAKAFDEMLRLALVKRYSLNVKSSKTFRKISAQRVD